jgi:hypothetical protein
MYVTNKDLEEPKLNDDDSIDHMLIEIEEKEK